MYTANTILFMHKSDISVFCRLLYYFNPVKLYARFN